MSISAERLTEYRGGSETAFAEIVREYSGLVYSVAKRRLGSGALAEEAAQMVFTRLATARPKLSRDELLAGWLHRTTLHVAVDLWRAESRRRAREEKAMELSSPGNGDEGNRVWEELAPRLDEAIERLNEPDRRAILLRFFERKPVAELAKALGTTEDAAKMRVSRAVEKLRGLLGAPGAACAGSALAALLAERAAAAAPSALSEKLAAITVTREPVVLSGGLSVRGIAVAVGTAVLLTLVVRQAFRNGTPQVAAGPSMTHGTVPAEIAESGAPEAARVQASRLAEAPQFDPITTRTKLRIVESETGVPIPNATVHMAYFYAGGVGESHARTSDAFGWAAIPFPRQEGNPGANVFVTAPGYVPKCVSWGRKRPFPEEYTMKLDRAETISGRVTDEEGKPMPKVKVTFRISEIEHDIEAAENIAFNAPATKSVTDAQGVFSLPFAPLGWREANVVATAPGLGVTQTNFTRGAGGGVQPLTVVMHAGATILGQVKDSDGKPVAGATLKQVHNYGWATASTNSDGEGAFRLDGMFEPYRREALIVAYAEGFAAAAQTVPLAERTNRVEFRLKKARPFRGRIVDPNGVPILGATIRTDSDSEGIRKYEWLDYSNVDGRFEWASAPDEETLFWFEQEGFQTLRGVPLKPDGNEVEIILRPPGMPPSSVRTANGPVAQPKVQVQFYFPQK